MLLRSTCPLCCAVLCSPEDLCWNPRHHMLAYAGEYGRDGSGAEFGEVHFRWK